MLASHFGTKLRPSPPQGVSASVLCRDVAWLTEELLFRNKDVGFGGSLEEVVRYSLSLLAPHLIIAAVPSRLVFWKTKKNIDKRWTANLCCLSKIQFPVQWSLFLHYCPCLPPSRKDPFIVPCTSLAATLHLTLQAQIVTHTFISEAVGGEWLSMQVFE